VIREEIEETRSQMSETVDALGYKADVKSRVKDSISDKKDAVVEKADDLVHKITGVVPDSDQMKGGAAKVKGGAQKVGVSKENPLGLAIGGAAVGLLAGLLLPSTRVEDQKLGEVSDQVMDRVKETGEDALERGKHARLSRSS